MVADPMLPEYPDIEAQLYGVAASPCYVNYGLPEIGVEVCAAWCGQAVVWCRNLVLGSLPAACDHIILAAQEGEYRGTVTVAMGALEPVVMVRLRYYP